MLLAPMRFVLAAAALALVTMQTAPFIKTEQARWQVVVKAAGIKSD